MLGLATVLLLAHGLLASAASLPDAQPLHRRTQPVLEPPRGGAYALTGLVGARLGVNVREWLLCAPASNPSMLQMFRDRDRAPRRDLVPWAGEFAGKYLISSVQALRLSRSEELRTHLEKFVTELISTQDGDGYLGPFPKSERMTGKGLWDLWGQYHCMLGLLYWHEETGDARALTACRKAADYFCETFLDGPKRVLHAGSEEMNESCSHIFCLLYEKTGEERYLRLAREIERDWETPPSGDYVRSALAGKPFFQCPKPRWESLHAIQAIAELYWITGDEKYRKAFEQIWWTIAEFDRHNTGGFTSGEQATGNPYDPRPIETCCTIAWMAITLDMLRLNGNPQAADELELATFNGVMGAQNPSGRWWTYNTPMDGERKASAHDIVFQARAGSPELNCCSVNAPRGLGILSEWAIMRATNGIALNYYGPGELTARSPSGMPVRIHQDTAYPLQGEIALTLQPERRERFALWLRIPGWTRKATVTAKGKQVPDVQPGAYLKLEEEWSPGDRIQLSFDLSPRLWVGERESKDKISLYHGPLLLAYDPRHDGYDPTKLPELDLSKPPRVIWPADGQRELPTGSTFLPPILLAQFHTLEGKTITLCDFATAGMAGNRYASWLPCRAATPTPFSRQNPLRAAWPTRPSSATP